MTHKYPDKPRGEILRDLVKSTPGDEGKWFAAAKREGLYAEALELAKTSPCDPRTLIRAAREQVTQRPDFAIAAGLLALRWLSNGFGYELTGADVWAAYSATIAAAERRDNVHEVQERIRQIISTEGAGGFARGVLGREFGM